MTGRFAARRISLAIGGLIRSLALPAQAQQPSKAETDAVRSNCRSDYMAKCMSVKPGGIEAIQCLKKNDASLSAACRAAVAAIKLPGEARTPLPRCKPASPPPAAAAAPRRATGAGGGDAETRRTGRGSARRPQSRGAQAGAGQACDAPKPRLPRRPPLPRR